MRQNNRSPDQTSSPPEPERCGCCCGRCGWGDHCKTKICTSRKR